jgi:hypothetical protein
MLQYGLWSRREQLAVGVLQDTSQATPRSLVTVHIDLLSTGGIWHNALRLGTVLGWALYGSLPALGGREKSVG